MPNDDNYRPRLAPCFGPKGKIGYMVKVSAVQDKALDLTDDISKVVIANLNHYYKEPINIPKDEEIQQIYKFFMYYPAMLVITDKKEYMISLNERQKGTRFWEDDASKREPYVIVHDWDGGSTVYGHVINKDTYDNTGQMVIYQLNIQENGSPRMKLESYMEPVPPKENNKDRAFYYIELTNKSDEIAFIHRSLYAERNSSEHNPHSAMFTSLPRGLLIHKKLLLFDDTVGCVYIVHDMHRVDLSAEFKNKQNLIKKRENVPYENYFICPKEYPKGDGLKDKDPNRCEKTNIPSENPTGGTTEPTKKKAAKWFAIVVGILIAAVLVVFLLIWIIKKKNLAQGGGSGSKKKTKTTNRGKSMADSTGIASSNTSTNTAATSQVFASKLQGVSLKLKTENNSLSSKSTGTIEKMNRKSVVSGKRSSSKPSLKKRNKSKASSKANRKTSTESSSAIAPKGSKVVAAKSSHANKSSSSS